MARRKNTPTQIRIRERYEQRLAAIEPLTPDCKKLLSAEGFEEFYLEMRMLYPSAQDAYEKLEEFHERVTGHRRYSEFNSFRYSAKSRRPKRRD